MFWHKKGMREREREREGGDWQRNGKIINGK
jgi:hypothetical protein